MKKKVGEFLRDVYPPLVAITETRARTDFSFSRDQAITLLEIHDQKTGGGKGRPPQELEALKRSALILAVTAWESFVEDTVSHELDRKLQAAKSTDELKSIFNAVAEEWLDPGRSPKRHGPDLTAWTGDGWKKLIAQSLSVTLKTFHTPNTENTNKLFKRYLGISIKEKWSWQNVSSAKAQSQLNALIELRGRVVHRGKTFHPLSAQTPDVQRSVVVRALNLLYNLVHATEYALGIAPKS